MSGLRALPGPATGTGAAHPHRATITRGLGRHLTIGMLALVILVFGVGGLAATIDFAGAVVTGGRLVVSSNVKKIQHQTGGTISRILVRDGSKVKTGDVLVQIDPTVAAANLAIVVKGLDDAMARRARLLAERNGEASIAFPEDLTSRRTDPTVAEAIAIETKAFETRRDAREGQKAQLRKKIWELEHQLKAIAAQEDAVARQIKLTADDLEGLRSLRARDLVSTDRLSNEERRAAQLDGEHGQLVAARAQIGAEIAQAELQIIQVDQDVRSEVSRELSDEASKINELQERKIAADDQLKRLTVTAPIDGTVYQMAVHTVGGVVGAGEPIMLIVPEDDVLMVEAHVRPDQVDRIHPEQEARIRFSSFGGRTTPEHVGTLQQVSPDLVTDERTGEAYYVARIKLPDDAFTELGGKMVPGMPVEVFIVTGDRTVLSYLFRPLGDQIMHTFRER